MAIEIHFYSCKSISLMVKLDITAITIVVRIYNTLNPLGGIIHIKINFNIIFIN